MSHITTLGIKLTDRTIMDRVVKELQFTTAASQYPVLGVTNGTLVTNRAQYPVAVISPTGEVRTDSDWYYTANDRQNLLQTYAQRVLEQQAALYGYSVQSHKAENGELVVEVARY